MGTKPDIISDARNFMKSRVILSAAELDFFSKLDDNFVSAKELAEMLDLDERATTRILDCLVTYDLLEKENNRFCRRKTRYVRKRDGLSCRSDKAEYSLKSGW